MPRMPKNERVRLARVKAYGLLARGRDPDLDEYARQAAEAVGTPMGVVAAIDADLKVVIGSYGPVGFWGPEEGLVSRSDSACGRTILQEEPFVAGDLLDDELFAKTQWVTGEPYLRFYAGVSLGFDGQSGIGTLSVIDTVPHNVSDGQKKRLVEIGKSLMTRLELKRLSGRWEALTGESAFFSMNESQMLAIEGRDKKIQEIKRGLAQDEFVNFYQPKVDLKTYMVNGAETLLRWNHPTRGILAPWEFIPLMEETGLIVEAGRNALLQSMRDWRRWKDEGLKPPQIAVNVAAGQFAGGKLLADVGEALSIAKGLMGEKPLGIEITESGLIENKEAISDQLREIRKLGVTVALDDFGTGYSSLSYLTQLPIDLIKIDRSFIQRLSDSPAHMTLVSAIIGMAHGLRLEVVAEGVETAEEYKLLRLLRCPEAQGFLFGKPMSGEKFAELLQSNAPLLGD